MRIMYILSIKNNPYRDYIEEIGPRTPNVSTRHRMRSVLLPMHKRNAPFIEQMNEALEHKNNNEKFYGLARFLRPLRALGFSRYCFTNSAT